MAVVGPLAVLSDGSLSVPSSPSIRFVFLRFPGGAASADLVGWGPLLPGWGRGLGPSETARPPHPPGNFSGAARDSGAGRWKGSLRFTLGSFHLFLGLKSWTPSCRLPLRGSSSVSSGPAAAQGPACEEPPSGQHEAVAVLGGRRQG